MKHEIMKKLTQSKGLRSSDYMISSKRSKCQKGLQRQQTSRKPFY